MYNLQLVMLRLLLISLILLSNVVSSKSKCGYSSCNPVKDGMLNVHLVPHTHDDVGWLKTVDQYYYGARTNYQRAGVQYILDSVIEELLKDKTKRFIYVEIAFFARWWRQQHDMTRHLVRGLVNEGRLEFILGGWCMNDEATTHYNAIVDQHALGFEFLRQNFGECGRPRVAWQIDPFGHSREQASLFAQMGFDGLFFGRLDYQDKAKRMNTTTMEMLWRGSPTNLGKKSDLFTGALFNGYGPPGGFCFDLLCNDDPIMDDEEMHDNNKLAKVLQFLIYAKYQAKSYATDHIIMTMGSDFNYQNAHTWYKNLDKLIQYVNEQQNNGSKVNLLYSTPSCYLYQLNRANKTWATKDDDFFPYAHRPHSFWSGYFTSRPTLKEFVRKTNNFLQVCKQMDALAQLDDDVNSTIEIQILREAMGVAQHHDAVSGTEKQHVAYDYEQRLAKGVYECQKVVNDAYNRLLPKGNNKAPGQLYCNLLNISKCDHTENYKQFVTTIYNPLGRNVTSWIRLPVIGKAYTVIDPYGYTVTAQIIPVSSETKRIPERKGSLAKNELVFKVNLPALGFNTYFIQMSNSILDNFIQRTYFRRLQGNGDITIKNQFVALIFDGSTGKLKQMQNLERGVTLPLGQDYLYYVGHPGNNSQPKFQASGAYIFRPNITATHQFRATLKRKSYALQGVLVQEVRQQFSSWLSQVVRLYDNERYAEFEWTVGPIPIQNNYGKEIISRFTSDLKTSGIFYTDANGREIIKRTRDHRDTWNLNQTEEIAGNYYPINSRIYIQDTARDIQLTVLTDRSQGGSSIQDGQVEIMVHRRLLHDDSLGVGEALNETGADGKGLVARGKHYVFLDTVSNSASLHRDMALRLYMAPSVSFSEITTKQTDWRKKYRTSWSGLKKQLPDNVHMLTLEQWGGPTVKPSPTQPYLLRFEHIYENGEDPLLSKPVNISLQDMFVPFEVETVEELTLGANLQLSKLQRLNWMTLDSVRTVKGTGNPATETGNATTNTSNPTTNTDRSSFVAPSGANNFTITLKPMDIRTFQVTLKKV